MSDTRVRVATTKPVNLAQLDAELGGHGLCGSDTEIVAVEGSPVTEAQLSTAIASHVATDPNAKRLAALDKLLALGLTVDDLDALGV